MPIVQEQLDSASTRDRCHGRRLRRRRSVRPMKCPKCSYERLPEDTAPSWQCPACKVAYAKVRTVARATVTSEHVQATQSVAAQATDETGDNEQERQRLAARGQKIVIYCILINFVLRAVDQTHAVTGSIVNLLYLCTAVFSLLGILKICSGLSASQNRKILCMVLSFFPLINLVVMVYLSFRTNRMLREAGWQTGLLGARP